MELVERVIFENVIHTNPPRSLQAGAPARLGLRVDSWMNISKCEKGQLLPFCALHLLSHWQSIAHRDTDRLSPSCREKFSCTLAQRVKSKIHVKRVCSLFVRDATGRLSMYQKVQSALVKMWGLHGQKSECGDQQWDQVGGPGSVCQKMGRC